MNALAPLTAAHLSSSSSMGRFSHAAVVRAALVVALFVPATAHTQMTIAGQVTTAQGAPVVGASVSIAALDLGTRTGDDGRYALLISATVVRGQSVMITARHSRFGARSVEIRITGGSLIRDFVLITADPPRLARDTLPPVAADPANESGLLSSGTIRSLDLGGAADLTSALTGRIAGLLVTSPNGSGASGSILFRGPRSLSATVQPLVVVDGIAVDNEGFTASAQRFGLGGFDYGSPLQDIAVEDIADVRLLTPLEATAKYGARAANGVLEFTTRNGAGITGLHVSVTSRITREGPTRLPSYQNVYGQGLGGQFEFFDGQGGGINDAVAENWGPRLDARPVPQHSLAESRRPEVRYWLPRANVADDYLKTGHTVDVGAALQGSVRRTTFRAAVNARDIAGITPNATARRLGVSVHGTAQPLRRASVTATLQMIGAKAEHRPGTGFDDSNPIAGFASFGRQVDLDSLRANVLDSNSDQINWIYTGRNNPFFVTARNANDDQRRHILGGLRVDYAFTPGVSATLHVGTNDHTTTRKVRVDSGWKGGFPTSLGRRDFLEGGTDHQSVAARERFARLSVAAMRAKMFAGLMLHAAADVEHRDDGFELVTMVADGASQIGVGDDQSLRRSTTSMSVTSSLTRGAEFAARVGARAERAKEFSRASGTELYPAVEVSYDFSSRAGRLRDALGLRTARLRGGWWSAGNEITRRSLLQIFNGTRLGVPDTAVSGAERTTGVELGVTLASSNDRLALDVSAYREHSTQLLIATGGAADVAVTQSGRVFNGGYAILVRGALIRDALEGAIDWDMAATFASNASTVDHLREGTARVAAAPVLFGASQVFEVGSPAGLIVGSRYLRDNASGALLLRDGLPMPDATQPFSILGSWQADWTASLTSRLRYGGVELQALLDVRFGGEIFSATNLWGSYTGTLETTLIGDRSPSGGDSLLIRGVDSLTGQPNATRVSAEQYFHALGDINEAWVYDGTYAKLREARLSYELPSRFLPGFREHRLRFAVFGRNLAMWTKTPNIDPETTLSTGAFLAFEMGQLPSSRSIGVQLSVSP